MLNPRFFLHVKIPSFNFAAVWMPRPAMPGNASFFVLSYDIHTHGIFHRRGALPPGIQKIENKIHAIGPKA